MLKDLEDRFFTVVIDFNPYSKKCNTVNTSLKQSLRHQIKTQQDWVKINLPLLCPSIFYKQKNIIKAS